jgi:hypothetical protein
VETDTSYPPEAKLPSENPAADVVVSSIVDASLSSLLLSWMEKVTELLVFDL